MQQLSKSAIRTFLNHAVKILGLCCAFIAFSNHLALAQQVITKAEDKGDTKVFTLSNGEVTQKIMINRNILQGDILTGNAQWLAAYHNKDHTVYTDGNYALKLMWTGWSAPGRQFNADVQTTFTKEDYQYTDYAFRDIANGGRELDLFFIPFNHENTVRVKLTYQLLPGKFYTKRKIALQDSAQKNWLEAFISRDGTVGEVGEHSHDTFLSQQETDRIIKRGEFGQPCAADFSNGGVFFGIEYPAANNSLMRDKDNGLHLTCKELMGKLIMKDWLESDWVVEGLAPDHHVKDWFFNYVPDIRVAANKPYALYNSWYDLRSPQYPGVEPSHVMNEKNILHIIDLFKKNMIDKYGIHLDAFVLDDGWDVYESDWQLRKETFSHGIAPVVNALKPLGTTLGIWFGPTGGYSFRMKRINWMKAHGYETVGSTPNDEMMDIAGPKYSALFEKRTTDFVKQGMGYFKWDGIQFSSSNPDNGHPVGYHSRRAALESIIDKCKAVRAINPDVFLNITSGTWMSPWWMQYANQIWMQGSDYGYADAPSVNERDAAITYKDIVLYNDFHRLDLWFPIGNLMTHGIIKGNLERLGGNDDPLDKFTDDAVFYFGRGVTMYELYISPDLLTTREWLALSRSLAWAKDRFDIMDKTYMVGGDPAKGEPYGFLHLKSDSGIVAVRNPKMEAQQITFRLDPASGIADSANSLVLEQTYPVHWISPHLYAAGATITLPLQGFEAAVYEIYPLQNATKPLLAGIQYEVKNQDAHHYDLHVLRADEPVKLLNPEIVKQLSVNGEATPATHITIPYRQQSSMLTDFDNHFEHNEANTTVQLDAATLTARYIVFLKPDTAYAGKPFPAATIQMDGKTISATKQMQNGKWACYSVVVDQPGKHTFRFRLDPADKTSRWSGLADIWLSGQQKQTGDAITITTNEVIKNIPMPPSPYEKGALKFDQPVAKGHIGL